MICERGFGQSESPFCFSLFGAKNSQTVANLDVSVASRQMKVVKRHIKMKSRHDRPQKV